MELDLSSTLLAGDPRLVDHIVGEVKSQGIFDQFRKECIADVDTKPAYQNLRTRVEGSVNSFLDKQIWKPDQNKNQLRETLRKHIHEASYLDAGVERIVDQVVNPKVYSVFMSQIEDVVYKFLGLERPKTRERNGACGLKDLLPKDLDPVSPESDKNSLKDVSLESVDGIEDLEAKKDEKLYDVQKLQEEENSIEKSKDNNSVNEQIFSEEKILDETGRTCDKTDSNLHLNTSGKSDDKTEEEEEDSPTFEPIDIMNLNESNISNDSHLSGISELTSHRSRSPDFSNELSRDNFEYSNQDSQLSKVSSDSRLSIVTDFGSSNHATTPLHDSLKEDVKNSKDNFKAVREFESNKNKNAKNIFDLNKGKDNAQDNKELKNIKNNLSSKENSRDAIDSSVKDKYDHKNSKDKSRDTDTAKSKSRERSHLKDSKHHRDKSSDKKKQRSHSSSKYDKYDKNKFKEKSEQPQENLDKAKDAENIKDNSNLLKEDKLKETDKKDSNKEAKDLKDLYKEKIRDLLREKKELTEKEKLNKDHKEQKLNKDAKDKKDSQREKKSYKKDHKSSSSKNSTASSHDTKTVRMSEKIVDSKDKRSESKDKGKRDERRSSKDGKSKNHLYIKVDSVEKLEKQDLKKISKNDKEEKIEKSEVKKDGKSSNEKINDKKDTKNHSQSKGSSRNEKLDSKKNSKNDSQTKDKKRREEKKSKSKDDHSSLRKNSNDRRSTDRDGSNGSSSKSSQSSNSSSNASNNKSGASTLSKETSNVSNSSSETSDSIEEAHTNDLKLLLDQSKSDSSSNGELYVGHVESESSESSLPLKKRPLQSDDNNGTMCEIKVKKPKFAKNIHEAKKLMKIRKQIEKQKLKESKKIENKRQQKVEPLVQSNTTNMTDNFDMVPDEERVQIIEIPDEEYEEPYPEKSTNLTLEARSIILSESEPGTKDLLPSHSCLELQLSDMELCIKQSLNNTISINKQQEIAAACTNFETQRMHFNSEDKSISENTTSSTIAAAATAIENNKAESDRVEGAIESTLEDCKIQEGASTSKEEDDTNTVKSNLADEQNTNDECRIENQSLTTINISKNDESHLRIVEEEAIQSKSTEVIHHPEDNVSNAHKDKTSKPSLNESRVVVSTSASTEDNEDCRYFKADNEKSEKFSTFLESLELIENSSLEDIIESMGGQVVSSVPKAMAPPLPKRKHSSSPLQDILLNNSNNNNDGHNKALNLPTEDALSSIKKKKLIVSKKQRLQANLCAPQGLLNGENFVMPLSPESDVSATSEKTPSSHLIKEDKGRHRSSQRYSSDDLYKPRPLFSSSSRRSRRSNQA